MCMHTDWHVNIVTILHEAQITVRALGPFAGARSDVLVVAYYTK
jgi:hypothetical protein